MRLEALLSEEDGARSHLREREMVVSQPLFLAVTCFDGSGGRQLLLHMSGRKLCTTGTISTSGCETDMDSLRGQPNPESRVRAEHIDRSIGSEESWRNFQETISYPQVVSF